MIIALACLGSFVAGIAVGMGVLVYRLCKLCPMFKDSCMKK